jgi:DNA-directed RNA polymerase specialized sigma subunit, sigma24 homolog
MKHRGAGGRTVPFSDDGQDQDDGADFAAAEAYMPLPEQEVIVAESIRDMQNGCFYAMVRRLTLEQRTTFSLVDMFGLSTAEAADLLGTGEGAVKAQLFRARMNLDAFFSGHCSVLAAENPCSCRAWQEFWKQRYRNQEEMRKSAANLVPSETLDWHTMHYRFNPAVRGRIRWLYAHMPDRQPDEKWFKKIIETVSSASVSASSK